MHGTRNAMARKKAAENTEDLNADESDNDDKASSTASDEESKHSELPDLNQEELSDSLKTGSESNHNSENDEPHGDRGTDKIITGFKKLDFNTKNDNIHYPPKKTTKLPTYKKMITEAIQTLGEKKGSFSVTIKKWIIANYPDAETPQINTYIKKAIKSGLEAALFYYPEENSNLRSRIKLVEKPIVSQKRNKGDSKQGKNIDDNKLFTEEKKLKKLAVPIKVVVTNKNAKLAKNVQSHEPEQPEKKKTVKAKTTKSDEKLPKKTKNPQKKTDDKENVEKANKVPAKKIQQKPIPAKKNIKK